MMQKIRVGERYTLSKHKPKRLYRYISLLAVLTTMCLYAVKQVSAQQAEPAATAVDDIKPLRIGDTIPEYLWHLPLQVVNHPEGKDTITLNDYRDQKLIILDFWATYCNPCIQSVEKLDSIIYKNFSNEAALIPVQVHDGAEAALPFMERRGWQVLSVVNDTLLNKQAFARYLTGFGTVWISHNRLLTVPRKKNLTYKNIAAAVYGNRMDVDNLTEQPLPND